MLILFAIECQSVFRMNNFVRSCLICSANRLRHCKTRIFPPPVHFHSKRYQSSSKDNVSNSIDVNLSDDFDYEAESPYSNIDFEAIANGDASKLKALKVLQLEVDLMRQQGAKVPVRINTERWKDLLIAPEKQRIRFLEHLWNIELSIKHAKELAKEKSKSYWAFKAEKQAAGPKINTTSSPIEYTLTDTALFHRIYESTITRLYTYKLLQAEWFGPKILVDCSYEPFMSVRNVSNCVKQMVITWASNRDHGNPSDLIFCNVDKEGLLWQKFASRIPMTNEPDSPVHFTTDHYLNLFPKNQLVYLTPYSQETLKQFNPDDIYIIGAFVDMGSHQPISLAKAKKEGLRMAKLPLDQHLRWVTGTKSLTVNQVFSILNDVKDGQSWNQAFRHVPKRKISAPTIADRDDDDKLNRFSPEAIREDYRKNLVYDLLLKERLNSNKS